MDVDEDDGYSDDDLDALPHDTFHQLQQDAFISTKQTSRPNNGLGNPNSRLQAKVSGAIAGGVERQSVAGNYPSFDQEFPQHPSSDYGDLDDEMLDGEIYDAAVESRIDPIQASRAAGLPYGESTQREQWRQQRYGVPVTSFRAESPGVSTKPQMKNGTNGFTVESGGPHRDPPTTDDGNPSRQADIEALHAQVIKLRQETLELENAKKAAEEAALAKSGEIAIIRANQSKSERAFEAKLSALQKLHAEEAARQRLEVERALAENHKIATEKGFLQNDIAEGNAQIRDLQRAVKSRAPQSNVASKKNNESTDAPITPKKNKASNLGDGFDDDEIRISSARLAYRSKPSTPKAGSKRKRKAVDASPAKPLQLSEANDVADVAETNGITLEQSFSADLPPAPATAPPGQTKTIQDDRFKLAQLVMNHHPDLDSKRTFEALAEYSYPSNPNKAMSTVFLDNMSTLSMKSDIENFPVSLASIVISMWKQCVQEQYWKPIYLLLDLTSYILCITPLPTAPLLVDTVLEVIQSTADVNVIPRVRRQPGKFSAEVNTLDCLELLKSIADDCLVHAEDIVRFWRCMRFDFIAMILNVVQPIEELQVTLGLLRTSIQEETFAMIVPPNDGKQQPSEMNLIDLLTRLLVENIKPARAEEPYDVVEIAELRLAVLALMEEMCANKHSSRALAVSQHAIGRLVWVMNDELDALYNRQYGHECRAELVNQATRLLFRLRTDHPQLINMQEKLK
ncbi:MAG: hypothetical protein Q9183_004375, partial [Haloplaca sp. 2 TL-2023]